MHIRFVLLSMMGDEVCTYTTTIGRILSRSLHRTEVASFC